MGTGVLYMGKMIYIILWITFYMGFHLALYKLSLVSKLVFVKFLKQVYDTSIGIYLEIFHICTP